jgi:hypothetical protein
MDSRQRFVFVFAALSMSTFSIFTFLNTNDIGLYVSSITIVYFSLRLIMNPKLRTRIDYLGIALLALFVYYIAQHVITILR